MPFSYRSKGNVVALGKFSGAVEFGGVVLGGFPGWLAWRGIHLVRITSFRNKLATLLDWSTGYVYRRDTARLEVEPAHPDSGVEKTHDVGKAGAGARP